MTVSESFLNSIGIKIEERPHRTMDGYTEDFITVNGKDYQTSYLSWEEKTLIIWDGENDVTDKIAQELNQ